MVTGCTLEAMFGSARKFGESGTEFCVENVRREKSGGRKVVD